MRAATHSRSSRSGRPPSSSKDRRLACRRCATSTNGDPSGRPSPFSGRTAWARSVQTPLREFLRTETGGAAVLLAAAAAALVWVNVDSSSYDSLWRTKLSIDIGGSGVALDLRHWVNSGLMTFFFFVVGLEARREFDLGDLRERRRFALPLLAGIGGMAAAVGVYLAFNVGRSSSHGWGIAMSTDTAFALGLLALVGPRLPDRLRAFMLTVVVVDDIVALVVIATVYSGSLHLVALVAAILFYGVVLVLRSIRLRAGLVYLVLGAGAWVALLESGVEPVVIGLAMGVLPFAYPAPRSTLERATERFREFREQPTAELARSASAQLRAATSLNERRHRLHHRAARRDPRLRRAGARGGEARHLERRPRRVARHVAALPRHRTPSAAPAHPCPARHRRAADRPLHRRRSQARPHTR